MRIIKLFITLLLIFSTCYGVYITNLYEDMLLENYEDYVNYYDYEFFPEDEPIFHTEEIDFTSLDYCLELCAESEECEGMNYRGQTRNCTLFHNLPADISGRIIKSDYNVFAGKILGVEKIFFFSLKARPNQNP